MRYCGCNRYKFTSEVKKNRGKGVRPQRTSTPVDHSADGLECKDTSEVLIPSVNDFFYQSWKNELDFDMCSQSECRYQPPVTGERVIQNFNYFIVNNHPVAYPSHMVPFYTFDPYFTRYCAPVIYWPGVGYREDGTYGVLPGCWFYYYS